MIRYRRTVAKSMQLSAAPPRMPESLLYAPLADGSEPDDLLLAILPIVAFLTILALLAWQMLRFQRKALRTLQSVQHDVDPNDVAYRHGPLAKASFRGLGIFWAVRGTRS